MNPYRTGLLVIATATLGLSAPPAHADIHYGGTGNVGNRATGPSMSLVRHDDGRITARLSSGYTCRKRGFVSRNVKLTGSTADGVSFTISGRTRLRGRGVVTYKVAGTLAADGVTGTLTEGARRCPKYSFNILLRPESAPTGAPAAPAPGSLLAGLTSQSAGGLRLPVALRVAKNGRVYGFFQVRMRCGPRAVVVFGNVTPTTAVKPDGTFTRSERFTIRYTDGSRERYRVRFAGRFLADGATGTLRARMQTRKPGKRYYPCDSRTQTWSART